ncbi:hypothetical protein [Sphingomonas sp. KR3-1]|uniref:hypothetical protein n=1 Tax=Sphingomonas sp. KR3-1 TaxID=3156611 RepID=UPI0032B4282D
MATKPAFLLRQGTQAIVNHVLQTGSIQGVFSTKTAIIRPVFLKPTLRPETVDAGRAIVRDYFSAVQAVAKNFGYTQASNETIISCVGEFGNNGYNDGDTFKADSSHPLDVEVHAAMADELINQQQAWRLKDLPTHIMFTAPNAVKLTLPDGDGKDVIQITAFASCSADKGKIFAYGKRRFSDKDGFDTLDADGNKTIADGTAFAPDTGPMRLLFPTGQGVQISIDTVICLDYSAYAKKPGVEPGQIGADLIVMQSRGALVGEIDTASPELRDRCIISNDSGHTADNLPEEGGSVVDPDAPIATPAPTGVWEVMKDGGRPARFADMVITRASGLLDMLDGLLGAVCATSLTDMAKALADKTIVERKLLTSIRYEKADGSSERLLIGGPINVGLLTDARITEVAQNCRDGKAFIAGVTPEAIDAASDADAALGLGMLAPGASMSGLDGSSGSGTGSDPHPISPSDRPGGVPDPNHDHPGTVDPVPVEPVPHGGGVPDVPHDIPHGPDVPGRDPIHGGPD